MFRALKWRRLREPIVYGGAALVLLCWIGLSETMQPPALRFAAGCLIALAILATGVNFARAKRRVELSGRRLRIGERRIAEAWSRLEAARQAADAADRAKCRFFADVSHELRTPLSGIVGMSRVLLESETDTGRRKAMETIAASSEALLVLANDVLDHARIEAGKLELRPSRFDLRHLLQDLVALSSALPAAMK